MPIALFMDEDPLHRDVLQALRRAGFDCLTATEAGREALSDHEQLQFSTATARVMLTRNTRDFSMLDAQWRRDGMAHGGIIVLTGRLVDPGTILRAMRRIADSFDEETIRAQFIHLRNYL